MEIQIDQFDEASLSNRDSSTVNRQINEKPYNDDSGSRMYRSEFQRKSEYQPENKIKAIWEESLNRVA